MIVRGSAENGGASASWSILAFREGALPAWTGGFGADRCGLRSDNGRSVMASCESRLLGCAVANDLDGIEKLGVCASVGLKL